MSTQTVQTNEPHSWKTNDFRFLLLVTLPPLVLLSMFIVGWVDWQLNSAKSNAALLQVFPEINNAGEVNLVNFYDDKASNEHTLRWKQLMSAADGIPGVSLYDDVKVTPPGIPFPQKQFIEPIAEQFAPVRRQLTEMTDIDEHVWLPVTFGDSPENLRGSFNASIPYLLRNEFLDAFHDGDSQRAMNAIKLLTRLYGPDAKRGVRVTPLYYQTMANKLVRASLKFDVWSAEELQSLQQIASAKYDWDDRWHHTIEWELFSHLPWLADQRRMQTMASQYGYRSPVNDFVSVSTIAPSELLGVFESFGALKELDSAGTYEHAKAAKGVVNRHLYTQRYDLTQTGVSHDQWLKVPFMRGLLLSNVTSRVAQAATGIAQAASIQRWTRTAIVIKQYRVKFGYLPQGLGELAKVDLPESATLNTRNKPFAFANTTDEDDENVVYLWNVDGMTPSVPVEIR